MPAAPTLASASHLTSTESSCSFSSLVDRVAVTALPMVGASDGPEGVTAHLAWSFTIAGWGMCGYVLLARPFGYSHTVCLNLTVHSGYASGCLCCVP